ncbi:MAG TPA: ABC transporter permease [Myxococcota bacterium]
MNLQDLLRFSTRGLSGHGLRTALSLLGVSIGVAAVVILTAVGEGARRYVVGQFAGLGTNILIVVPGRTETSGAVGAGGVPNDLTLEDTRAIQRAIPAARRVAPVSLGTEQVSYGDRRRQVAIIGTTHEYREVRNVEMMLGRFLPQEEMFRGSAVVVLGHKLARELFDGEQPLGEVVRVGGFRMRVIGVLAKQGVKMGMDFDDLAMVPVSTGMQMFNRSSLFRILIQARSHTDLHSVKDAVRGVLIERHDEEDITVITQDSVLSTFTSILRALTLAVGAIAAISLSVAGIGIMNVMLVSVSERTREVGLLKALGVDRRQILSIFLTEAALISLLGGLAGLFIGWLGVRLLVGLFPAFPASPPAWAVVAALAVSIGVGVTFGLLPARRASRLDPVLALAGR